MQSSQPSVTFTYVTSALVNKKLPPPSVQINLIWNLQGMGETIRGTINGAVDTAFNDKAGEAKNRSIAANGVAEMQDGELKGHGDGAHAGAVGSMSSVPSVDGGTATSGGGRTL